LKGSLLTSRRSCRRTFRLRETLGRTTVAPAKAVRSALLLIASLLLATACRQDMHDAPRVEAYEATDAFADGRGNRQLVEGTVARGWLNDDELLTTGKVGGTVADQFPFPVSRDVLERGRQRYNAYCTPCHGQTGQGNGMVVQRGFKAPPSFHDDRLRNSPAGYYFDVMTNGFGVMSDYRSQVEVRDRWAIAAYIRALQLSQRATVADVPADKVGDLDRPAGAAPAPGPPGPGH
jgi:mono/diheme cytochrome c family protein